MLPMRNHPPPSSGDNMLRHSGIYSKYGDKQRPIVLPTGTSREGVLGLSILLNFFFAMILMFLSVTDKSSSLGARRELKTWNGGHPTDQRKGSCWCGAEDNYCMCTPNLAIDLIIGSGKDHVWLVRRKDTQQLATMGGFVNTGETIESAVRRELFEEMKIELIIPPKLFGVYSDPRRDNRRSTASVVFSIQLTEDIVPRSGDDVKDVERVALFDLEKHSYFADHKTILMDYRRSLYPDMGKEDYGDFAKNIVRSTCDKEYGFFETESSRR